MSSSSFGQELEKRDDPPHPAGLGKGASDRAAVLVFVLHGACLCSPPPTRAHPNNPTGRRCPARRLPVRRSIATSIACPPTSSRRCGPIRRLVPPSKDRSPSTISSRGRASSTSNGFRRRGRRLYFANGLQVTPDERYAIVAESFRFRLTRLRLDDREYVTFGSLSDRGIAQLQVPASLRKD